MKANFVTNPGSLRIAVLVSTYARSETDHEVPWLRESVMRLVARGHKVTVIAPAYHGLRHHQIDNVPVHRFRYAPSRWEMLTHGEGAPNKLKKNPILNLLTLTYVLGGVYAAWRICLKERVDILHVHWPFPHGLMALLPAWLPGSSIVYSCHSAELALAAGSKAASAVLAFCLKKADVITANSAHTASLVQDLSGQSAQIIPWGASIRVNEREGAGTPHQSRTINQQSALSSQSAEEPPLLLFSGRLIERKGVNYLLQAMPLILRQQQVRLVITGDGHYRQRWERLSQELQIDGLVRFAGFVSSEELSTLFATCSIYVHPAIHDSKGDTEGQGVVLVEALCNRKPVFASEVGGITDVIKNGETGLLVPEKNPQAIADAVLRLLNNPAYAARLGEQGYQYAQDYFNWNRIMDQYETIYRECVLSSRPPSVEEQGIEPVTT
jgi:glycosyltransferase involved in cell wall biosynthesis